jgi:uncharacterized cupin superfamily protein
MGRIDPAKATSRSGARYPAPHSAPCDKRSWLQLGDVAGLTQFGVNLCTLPPGAWSSQRHWHSHEDEFVWVTEGELVLVTDAGETVMRPGDCAGFKAGDGDGHVLQNRSDRPARFLAVGTRIEEDRVVYSDIDLTLEADGRFYRKDGTAY